MPTFLHKKYTLGGMAFVVPPRYIIEPLFYNDLIKRSKYAFILKVVIVGGG